MKIVVELEKEEALREVVNWASIYYKNPSVNAVITTPKKFYDDFIEECFVGGYSLLTPCMKMIDKANEVLVGHYDSLGGVGTKLEYFIRDNFEKIKEEIKERWQ